MRQWSAAAPNALLLGVLALIAMTGCASGVGSRSTSDSGFRGYGADPAAVGTRTLDCRNRGVYNRAADRCVSEGP